DNFEDFYKQVQHFMLTPRSNRGIHICLPNQVDMIQNKTILDLFEAALYGGYIHSRNVANPKTNSLIEGLTTGHSCEKHMKILLFHSLASEVIKLANLIEDFCKQIKRLAVQSQKE